MDDNDTTLEVVSDDQGGAAWRECGPGGCTTSRQRLDEKACNAARATLEVLVADANGAAVDTLQTLAEAGRRTTSALASFAAVIGLAATALRWTLPIRWESKRRKRRARGRQREAKRMAQGQDRAGAMTVMEWAEAWRSMAELSSAAPGRVCVLSTPGRAIDPLLEEVHSLALGLTEEQAKAEVWRSLTNPSLGQPWEASDDA